MGKWARYIDLSLDQNKLGVKFALLLCVEDRNFD